VKYVEEIGKVGDAIDSISSIADGVIATSLAGFGIEMRRAYVSFKNGDNVGGNASMTASTQHWLSADALCTSIGK
jgi:hypothetical protein